ncbi:MAG: cytochrome c-type biogenesis protein CcmH, partial [Acidobacteriota bacterium]|nr:cytochrome c-type biogenesis protein CcmH [Acidobacteriota bacterium]
GPPISGEALVQSTDELSSRMRCPVCQALSVADSPSLSAIAIKEEVRDLLAAGYTEEQVIDYFERAYGEFIRLAPKPEGFNLVVWLAPAAAFLLGAALVAMRLRRRGQPPAVGSASGAEAGGQVAGTTGDEDLSAYLARVREDVGSRT